MSQPQHMEALALAQRTRIARAALRRELAELHGTTELAERFGELVLDPPDEVASASVFKVLCWCPRWGRGRARRFLLAVRLSEMRQVGTLTMRERALVATTFREVTTSGRRRARVAA